MAKATLNEGKAAVVEVKEVVVEAAVPETVTLELTRSEAETVRVLAGNVIDWAGGSQAAKDAEAIYDALRGAGVYCSGLTIDTTSVDVFGMTKVIDPRGTK